MADEAAIYGVRYKARALGAVHCADEEAVRFLVGTTSLRGDNEVHLVEYKDEHAGGSTECLQIFAHKPEVWALAPSPTDEALFFTCYNTGSESGATLCRAQDGSDSLDEVLALPAPAGSYTDVLWSASGKQVAGLDKAAVRVLAVDAEGGSSSSVCECAADAPIVAGCWDPHDPQAIATAQGNSVAGWDLRTQKAERQLGAAHGQYAVRDVDFNPNRPYHLLTGGQDRKVRFWDWRKSDQPIKEVLGHSHWVWRARFNRAYDQLVLSAGTDALVNLWNVASISSAFLDDFSEEPREKRADGLVKKYDDHDDSVYALAWSATDAWVFASLSYDGRMVVNRVPREEKYKVLL